MQRTSLPMSPPTGMVIATSCECSPVHMLHGQARRVSDIFLLSMPGNTSHACLSTEANTHTVLKSPNLLTVSLALGRTYILLRWAMGPCSISRQSGTASMASKVGPDPRNSSRRSERAWLGGRHGSDGRGGGGASNGTRDESAEHVSIEACAVVARLLGEARRRKRGERIKPGSQDHLEETGVISPRIIGQDKRAS